MLLCRPFVLRVCREVQSVCVGAGQGSNGAGKTALASAAVWALTGKLSMFQVRTYTCA